MPTVKPKLTPARRELLIDLKAEQDNLGGPCQTEVLDREHRPATGLRDLGLIDYDGRGHYAQLTAEGLRVARELSP